MVTGTSIDRRHALRALLGGEVHEACDALLTSAVSPRCYLLAYCLVVLRYTEANSWSHGQLLAKCLKVESGCLVKDGTLSVATRMDELAIKKRITDPHACVPAEY